MIAPLVIVFREVLEAALIIGVLAAATRGVPNRLKWILAGVGLGVLGAVIVALCAQSINNFASGSGEEWFNAAVLLAASSLIAWHVIWMAQHGAALSTHTKEMASDVVAGRRTRRTLTVVVALAVLREGSEVVLFGYGLLVGGSSAPALLVGALLGLALGAATGALLYLGLLRIPLRYVFKATNALLVILAAGLASAAAAELVEADAIPSLLTPIWDSSWLLQDDTMLGRTLHVLIGYTDHPSGAEVVVYIGTLALLIWGMRRPSAIHRKTDPVFASGSS